jgi:plasmid stabilization system protein ParE
MKRRVELHPAADRDLERFVAFLSPLSERAARNRSKKIREKLRLLAEMPFSGREGPEPNMREFVIRIGKSSYVVRYRVTDDAVIITRIWHGKENRPP